MTNKDIKKLSFEESLKELETIVTGLESGQTDLEKAIDNYTRGTALKEHCDGKLKEAALKVEKIVAEGQNLGLKTQN